MTENFSLLSRFHKEGAKKFQSGSSEKTVFNSSQIPVRRPNNYISVTFNYLKKLRKKPQNLRFWNFFGPSDWI